MRREYYSDASATFLDKTSDQILGELQRSNNLDSARLERTQSEAWDEQIRILKDVLAQHRREGKVYFEYSIPRLGRRIDVVLLLGPVIFVLEFKVFDEVFKSYAIDQVWDYALDLKNFHETSHAVRCADLFLAAACPSGDACRSRGQGNKGVSGFEFQLQKQHLFTTEVQRALRMRQAISGWLLAAC